MKVVIIFCVLQLNGFLMRTFWLGHIDIVWLTGFQLGLALGIGVAVQRASRQKKGQEVSWAKRLVWGSLAIVGTYLYLFLVQAFFPIGGQNQAHLVTLQGQVPALSFYLFLVTASLGEEYLYRHLLWEKLPTAVVKLGLTSLFFTLAHSPQGVGDWLTYGGLALALGGVRLKTDLVGVAFCHLAWNTLVFGLSTL